ncbi:MAG: hypothetical protein R3E64_13705 [Halioglobus sp.]
MPHSLKKVIPIVLLLIMTGGQESRSDPAQVIADASPTDTMTFSSDTKRKGCELLSADIVSATFDIPVDALRQRKMMGCRYSWENESETLEAGISLIQVHKSEEAAIAWFNKAAASRTAEQMQADMETAAKRVDTQANLNTELKKATAKKLLALVGSKAVTFTDVAGIGDAARVNDEGIVYVRVGNLTFLVTAYKGAKAPPLDFTGVDYNKMAAAAQEHAVQWAQETAPQRRKDSVLLARAITDAM